MAVPQVPGLKCLARVAPLLVAAFLVLFMFLAALAAFAILSFRVIRQDQRQAYLQTTRDPLSGLLNRNGLFRKLQNAHKRLASSGLSHSLLYLDLDGFKDVNDTYGHTAGDQLIHAVGVKLSLLAPGHARTARVGGDEFAILIPDDNGQAARSARPQIDRAFLNRSNSAAALRRLAQVLALHSWMTPQSILKSWSGAQMWPCIMPRKLGVDAAGSARRWDTDQAAPSARA